MGRIELPVLSERPLRRLLAAQWTSLSGDFTMIAALPFVVYSLGGGSTQVGIAFATGVGALLVLVLLGGVLADRHGRRRVLIVAEAMRMLTQAILAALLLTGTARYWEVLAAQVSIGAGTALARPALTGLVAEIVAPQGRQSANALRGMLSSLAMVSGPALAGVAIAFGGPGAAVAFDAASYATSALLLISLGTVISTRVGEGLVPRRAFAADLRAGWVEFSTRTWLWVMVGAFAAVNLFIFGPFEVLGADTADASLGGAGAWSAILVAFGFGSLLGALLASAWQPRRPLRATACLLLAWVPLLLALSGPAPLAAILAAAAITGAGWLLLAAIWEATLQTRIAPERLSRVASYDWLGSNALLPVGLSLAAPIGAALGSRTTLLLAAAVAMAITGAALAVPSVRLLPQASALDDPARTGYGPAADRPVPTSVR